MQYFNPELNEENNSGLFEGDIELTEAQKRIIMSGDISSYSAQEGGNWPQGIIPYKIIDSSNTAQNSTFKFKDFTEKQRELIMEAMRRFHDSTCLRFIEKGIHDQYYIYIINQLQRIGTKWEEKGCSAVLGRDPLRRMKGQKVHLSKSCFLHGNGTAKIGT